MGSPASLPSASRASASSTSSGCSNPWRISGCPGAAIANAKATLALRETETPLEQLMWQYRDQEDGKELSRKLKAAGFKFVGPTTVYSSMEACGIVNDHIPDCWVRDAVEAERRAVS